MPEHLRVGRRQGDSVLFLLIPVVAVLYDDASKMQQHLAVICTHSGLLLATIFVAERYPVRVSPGHGPPCRDF